MANLSSFQRKIEGQYDLLEIGDLITVLTSDPAPSTYFEGKFVQTNSVYGQNEYPDLFNKLGFITASGVTYDTCTQFFVPNISKSYPTVEGLVSNLSGAKFTTYMRAK
jgi:hypothetical protein